MKTRVAQACCEKIVRKATPLWRVLDVTMFAFSLLFLLKVKALREDSAAQELFEVTCEDAQLGRMSKPIRYDAAAWREDRLVPRFAVVKQKVCLLCFTCFF